MPYVTSADHFSIESACNKVARSKEKPRCCSANLPVDSAHYQMQALPSTSECTSIDSTGNLGEQGARCRIVGQ